MTSSPHRRFHSDTVEALALTLPPAIENPESPLGGLSFYPSFHDGFKSEARAAEGERESYHEPPPTLQELVHRGRPRVEGHARIKGVMDGVEPWTPFHWEWDLCPGGSCRPG